MPIEAGNDHFKSLSSSPRKGSRQTTGSTAGGASSLRPGYGTDHIATRRNSLVNPGYSKAEPKVEYRLPDAGSFEPKPGVAAPERALAVESLPAQPSSAKESKRLKQQIKDRTLLKDERWLVRNGHFITFIGLYLFSIMVLFRPYELMTGLGFLQGTAFYFAAATLAIFLPSQLAAESNLTIFSREVKAVLALTIISMLTIPIAKDPKLAWDTFNEPFIKAVVIFIVLVNVVRTRQRLMSIMWLSFGIGIYLGISAIDKYMRGEFAFENYRVAVDVGGMFGNPNDMALHFVMMTPLVFALAVSSRSFVMKLVYFALTVLFIAANMVTFSRGGFLGLVAAAMVFVWKLGRRYRLKVTIGSIAAGLALMIFAPGQYGLRMLSIFIPGLDSVGSSDARQALLTRSILVSLRNPWGIGIGNFPIVGQRDQVTHNAFTQVSAEIGVLGLIAYMIFIIVPFRKLGAIERKLFDAGQSGWYYHMAIGLQASIVGYMVSSFFASVAYNWFIYYLIAYAVAFRRIYSIEAGVKEEGGSAVRLEPVAA